MRVNFPGVPLSLLLFSLLLYPHFFRILSIVESAASLQVLSIHQSEEGLGCSMRGIRALKVVLRTTRFEYKH